ncbi:helix-turn-helix domain-containing protein [Chryseobacterium sp. GM_Chr_2]|uniref:winged helix-turn-helix transcriptional regulator n=1 Tax=unclassified Chryseobacterium TaxID=2593645 RepID=UPI003209770A
MTKSNGDIRVTILIKYRIIGNMDENNNNPVKECSYNILCIHDAMDVIGGRWKVSIIACLCFQPMRYSELLREVKGISGKMLSRELKDMEINQLISRTVIDTQPMSVVYDLTEYGKTLKDLTLTIANWGRNHRKKIIES